MPGVYRVHTDAILSNLAIQFAQDSAMFIGAKILKPMKVKNKSDEYYIYRLKDVLTKPAAPYIPDFGEASEYFYDVSTGSYACIKYGHKSGVSDDAKKNADSPLDLPQDTVLGLTQTTMIDYEARVAALVFDSSTTFSSYTSALGANDKWDAYTSTDSDPFADVDTAQDSIRLNALKVGNTMSMGVAVFDKVKHHPVIMDRIKYTGSSNSPALVTENTLAQAFGMEQVLVGRTVYNNANKGQTVNPANVWGKFVNISYVAPTPPRKGVTLGATMQWNPFKTRRWRDEAREGEWFQVQHDVDEVIFVAGAGYVFSTVVS